MTTGEGGIVVTNNSKLAKQMIFLRGHAMSPETRFWHTDIGYNYRLSNLLCAIGVAQLERFPKLLAGRNRVIATYRKNLNGCCGVRINPYFSHVEASPWLACVWLPPDQASKRDKICEELESRGIETRPFFYPVHTMPPYKKYRMIANPKGLRTDGIAQRGFNIPTSSDLTNGELKWVSMNVQEVLLKYCSGKTVDKAVKQNGVNGYH